MFGFDLKTWAKGASFRPDFPHRFRSMVEDVLAVQGQLVLSKITELLRRGRKGYPHINLGLLLKSITVEPIKRVGAVSELRVMTPREEAWVIEYGMKPKFPPIAPIREWARRKLGLTGRQLERLAFAVAFRISQRGLPPARIFERALKKLSRPIFRALERAISIFLRYA